MIKRIIEVNTLFIYYLRRILSSLKRLKGGIMEEIVTQHEDDYVLLQKEAHYVHTINAFVELIVEYGWDKVTSDLRTAMGNKTW